MKILFRNSIIWNQVLFLMFAFLLIHISNSIVLEASPFSLSELKKNLLTFKWSVISIFITSILILGINKYSKYVYFFTLVLVASIVISLLFINFSKLVLILLFFFALCAYYNFQLLKEEIVESYYNPNYSNESLFEPMLINIPCQIKSSNSSVSGYLSNWNENGCFVFLKDQQKLKGRVQINVELDGKVFSNTGHIVSQSSNGDGVGIKFYDNNETVYNWINFHKIIKQKGFSSELVK